MIHAIAITVTIALGLFGIAVIYRAIFDCIAPPPRNHHAKHSHGDEHAEGWAVGGGFINHRDTEFY